MTTPTSLFTTQLLTLAPLKPQEQVIVALEWQERIGVYLGERILVMSDTASNELFTLSYAVTQTLRLQGPVRVITIMENHDDPREGILVSQVVKNALEEDHLTGYSGLINTLLSTTRTRLEYHQNTWHHIGAVMLSPMHPITFVETELKEEGLRINVKEYTHFP